MDPGSKPPLVNTNSQMIIIRFCCCNIVLVKQTYNRNYKGNKFGGENNLQKLAKTVLARKTLQSASETTWVGQVNLNYIKKFSVHVTNLSTVTS